MKGRKFFKTCPNCHHLMHLVVLGDPVTLHNVKWVCSFCGYSMHAMGHEDAVLLRRIRVKRRA